MERDETPNFTHLERHVVLIVAILLFVFALIPPIQFIIIGVFLLYVVMRVTKSQDEDKVDSKADIVIDDSPPLQGEIDTVRVSTECSSCGKEIGLNTIKWIDKTTVLCPYCESVIKAI